MLFTTHAHARGPAQCIELFTVHYGELKSDFKHDNHYDVTIPDTVNLKDQCSTSHCHMYTWSAELENSSGIQIANSYLDAMRLYDQALMALKLGKTNLELGSFAFESRNAIRKYGIVPESAWKGSKDFIKSSMYGHLENGLEAILVRVAWVKASTQEKAVKTWVIEEAKREILMLIENITGSLPKEFVYENQTYTPRSFAKAFFPELYVPIIDVRMDAGTQVVQRKATGARVSLKMDFLKAEKLMRDVLDHGRALFLGYRHHRQFVDSKTGAMTVDGFAYPMMATALTAAQMSHFAKWGGSHAVLVVGYELDPATQRVRKWKIQNSWGEKNGDQGYFHMYRDYFEKFAWGFAFVEDATIPLPKSVPAPRIATKK
jgi:bleomycin hydrolase